MDKILLALGCSFTSLIYHPDPRWSYTYKIAKEFGFKLVNLGYPAGAPETINRILIQYLQNPVYGKPDFIFAQFPHADRFEVYLDDYKSGENFYHCKYPRSEGKKVLSHKLNWKQKKFLSILQKENLTEQDWIRNFEQANDIILNWAETSEQDLTKKPPEDCIYSTKENNPVCISNNTLNFSGTYFTRQFESLLGRSNLKQIRNAITVTAVEDINQIINLHTQVNIFENLCQKYNIDYAYVESDYSLYDSEHVSSCFVDEIIKNDERYIDVYPYISGLCKKTNFIDRCGINHRSPTGFDRYADNHPGKQSHEAFANHLIPRLHKFIKDK